MSSDEAKKQRLFDEAARMYLDQHEGESDLPQPNRDMSRITLGVEPSVALRSDEGVPLGTVSWFGGTVTFEPPTRVTVVGHLQGLRPSKP